MVKVELRGKIEPVYLDGEMLDVIKHMNTAMANGNTFFVCDDSGGSERVVNMREILTMGDGDEDDAFIG